MLYKEFNMDEALETRGDECFEKGIAIGERRGIAIGEQRGKQQGITIGERRGKQQGIAIGEQRGKQQGINIGIEKGKIDLAKSLLDQGVSEEVILKATGFSREELIGNK